MLSIEEIGVLGFEWPKHALIKQYLIMESGRIDLAQTVERMQSSQAFHRKQINEAYAFKSQTGADYADFTDRFDDIVRLERELGQSIAHLEEIMAAAEKGGAEM
ncbi:MAG: hypothetical protein PVI09_00625 [Anaerolineae bacterium]|jgi:hypothetical protein